MLWAPITDELLSYRCKNMRMVRAIMTDMAEEEAVDTVETNIILAL